MATHEATAQMSGYLYQIRYALLALLKSEQTNSCISIERFDDIAFDDGFSVIEMIQTKHHGRPGSLSDKSVDLWKTINVWLDRIDSDHNVLSSCRFIIITTEIAKEQSAASLLKQGNRDEERAIRQLNTVAAEHGNESLKAIFDRFLSTDHKLLQTLFKCVEVVDGAPSIVAIEKELRNRIRVCCFPGYEDRVMEQVEGWWFKLVVDALASNGRMVDYPTVQSKIASIGQQYQPDNLPIEQWTSEEISDEDLTHDQRIFIRQLRLIDATNQQLRRASKNFYRASQQRSSWAREELLLPNELEDYEQLLIDEWDQCRSYFGEPDDPVKQGKQLYKEVMEKNLFIRKFCTERYVMRGSYEMLADRLEVGWHSNYKDEIDLAKSCEGGQH